MVATHKNSFENQSKVKSTKGPRVKRVCRSAGVIKRPSVARFSCSREQLKSRESDCDSDDLPVDEYLMRKWNNEAEHNNDTTTLTKKKKTKKNTSLKVNSTENKISEQNKNKKKKKVKKELPKNSSTKKYRCKKCEGCKKEDCGACIYCRDKKKFGGSNVIKQACKYRTCIRFTNQENEKKKKKIENDLFELRFSHGKPSLETIKNGNKTSDCFDGNHFNDILQV